MNASLAEIVKCIILLVAIGMGLWVINTKIPMESWVKAVLNAVVCIAVLLWVLKFLGVL